MEEQIKKLTEGIDNKGHKALIDDLADLLIEAVNLEFHDFGNKKYPTPKMELRKKLLTLAEYVVVGKYDN